MLLGVVDRRLGAQTLKGRPHQILLEQGRLGGIDVLQRHGKDPGAFFGQAIFLDADRSVVHGAGLPLGFFQPRLR